MFDQTNDEKEKRLIVETKICSICLLIGSTDDNDPIVFCDRCGIIVHESCYNADALDENSSDSSSPCEYWFCSPCLGQIDDPICALCPTIDRCQPYWPTLESTWIHSICALAVPGVLYYDELYYTPVDISNIPIQKFGNKICQICEQRSGVTVGCDAGLCPNVFHISCANKNGLLQIRGDLSKIECELYCVNHQSSNNQYKVYQRNFSICEIQQKEFDRRESLNDLTKRKLIEQFEKFDIRSSFFPKLPKPCKIHSSRSLMFDNVSLKEFFLKSKRLGSKKTLSKSTLINRDLKLRENNLLIDFIENQQEILQLIEQFEEKQNEEKQNQSSKIDKDLKEEQKQLEDKINDENKKNFSIKDKFTKLNEILQNYNVQLTRVDQFSSIKFRLFDEQIQMNCFICHENDQSKEFIQCSQCQHYFHGQCLKPAMNRKTLLVILSATKKYQWECSNCVQLKQEQIDQNKIDVNQPRQSRRKKPNEIIFDESFLQSKGKKRNRSKSIEKSSNQQEIKSKLKSNRNSLIEHLLERNSEKFDSNFSFDQGKKKNSIKSSTRRKIRSKSVQNKIVDSKVKKNALSQSISVFDFSDEDSSLNNQNKKIRRNQ